MKESYLLFLVVLILFQLSAFEGKAQDVRINELMSVNDQTLSDTDNEYVDWIEIYNSGEQAFDMTGWTLTDDPMNIDKWHFPAVLVEAGSYLIVFASGKDTVYNQEEIHTNFKLSGDGEYLGLYSPEGVATSEITPNFPPLEPDHSYGWLYNGWVIFYPSSPGKSNTEGTTNTLPAPVFSHSHGYYENALTLTIDPLINQGTTYYSTDGSIPTPSHNKYEQPLYIDSTTVLRAKTFSPDGASSITTTQSYLFPQSILHQSNSPAGYPDTWGDFVEFSGKAPADYEMDPEIISDSSMASRTKAALLSLPVISLASEKGNFFSTEYDEESGGIYVYTGAPGDERGLGWERPVSFEYFNDTNQLSFQVNCGIRLHGGHSRRPEKSPKHSFRLVFKDEYGPGRLNYQFFEDTPANSFNDLVLRSGYGNTWIHRSGSERNRAQYGRDTWSKDTQREMGHHSSHSKFAHLFINGIYWGIYNPGERVDKEYAEFYMGGDADDYDVIKDYAEVADGEIYAWNYLIQQINRDIKDIENYYNIQGRNEDGTLNLNLQSYIDTDNLIDYMLLNFYGGNTDWDHHNWIAIRNRENPGNGFQFFAWDQEHVLKSRGENTTSEYNYNCPSNIFQRMKYNEIFKRKFADRVLLHCTQNGVLTPEANISRWMRRSEVLEKAIDAESARWGDYRRDVHRYFESDDMDVYTRDEHWYDARQYLLELYFMDRTEILLDQLRDAGLYPDVDAPVFLINDRETFSDTIQSGDILKMQASRGTIYYTTDGEDPVSWYEGTGSPSTHSARYEAPISLNHSVKICARTFYNNEWSAMRTSILSIPEDLYSLRLTEIHYNPVADSIDGEEYEFIELKNTGDATLNLKGITITDGVSYTFDEDIIVPSGEFAVLASNSKRFYERYNKAPSAEYKGSLSNGGEKIAILNSSGDTLIFVNYNDKKGWPEEADGFGPSMVPTDFNPIPEQNSPELWRASYHNGGSPFNNDDAELNSEKEFTESVQYTVTAFPNPFKYDLTLQFSGNAEHLMEVQIYNSTGERIKTISKQTALDAQITWDGTNQEGYETKPGIYICKAISQSGSVQLAPIKVVKIN